MKSDKSIFLTFPNLLSIEVKGNFEYDEEEVQILANTYLPGVVIEKTETDPDVSVEYIQSLDKHLEKDGDNYRIFDEWQGKLSLDLWHFLYSILRVYLLKNNLFSIHGACVGKEKHVLLTGPSGSGKSTVLLKLLNDYDWTAYSGNKTVVSFEEGRIVAIAGTKSMSLRSDNTKRFANLSSKIVEYQDRTAYLLDDRHYTQSKKALIDTIYIVKLNDGVSEIETLNTLSSMHSLYPLFLDTVNADTIMCEGNGVFVGTPPEDIQISLVSGLNNTLRNIKVIKITGSLDFIVENIIKK